METLGISVLGVTYVLLILGLFACILEGDPVSSAKVFDQVL